MESEKVKQLGRQALAAIECAVAWQRAARQCYRDGIETPLMKEQLVREGGECEIEASRYYDRYYELTSMAIMQALADELAEQEREDVLADKAQDTEGSPMGEGFWGEARELFAPMARRAEGVS